MASYMVKVASEGLVAPAHKKADPGPTSGSAIIYEITNVPDGVGIEEVIAKFKAFKRPTDVYEVDWDRIVAA